MRWSLIVLLLVGSSSTRPTNELGGLHTHLGARAWAPESGSNASDTNTSARELSGVHYNKAGDLVAFIGTLITNLSICIVALLIFPLLKNNYPRVYSENRSLLDVTDLGGDGYFGWIWESFYLDTDQVEQIAGLDQAMLLEFMNLSLRILALVTIPAVIVLIPLHVLFGGWAAGDDSLSYVGMANVKAGSWICWVHALAVWYVVFVVELLVLAAQKRFVPRRQRWLLSLQAPRSKTILIHCIPDQYCRDSTFLDTLEYYFPGEVEHAFVVKKTETSIDGEESLASLMRIASAEEVKLMEMSFQLDEQKAAITKAETGDNLEQQLSSLEAQLQDAKQVLLKAEDLANNKRLVVLKEFEEEDARKPVDVEEAPVSRMATGGLGVLRTHLLDSVESELRSAASGLERNRKLYGTSGFVTFKKRRSCYNALIHKFLTSDSDEFIITSPPGPADVNYKSLQTDPEKRAASEITGKIFITLMFFAFTPLVVLVSATTASGLDGLQKLSPSFNNVLMSHESAYIAVRGMLSSIILTLLMSLIPTFLIGIYTTFFALESSSLAQARIQKWYLIFQVVFVLLVTAVGSSLLGTMKEVIQHPPLLFSYLAQSLPRSTHFYLSFMTIQWVDHAKCLLRLPNLGKFRIFAQLFGENHAKELSEPEDQDYDGMGSRCARLSFLMVVTLTFCTLSPLIGLLGFASFALCRLVYGYLVVFAETKKPDLGGQFWVTALQSISWSLLLFIALMVGVLSERSASAYPPMLAFSSLALWADRTHRLHQLRWERLSLQQVIAFENNQKGPMQTPNEQTEVRYMQPEFATRQVAKQ